MDNKNRSRCRMFRALGTLNEITVFYSEESGAAVREENAENALKAAENRVLTIDDKFSVYKGNSEISYMNKMAGKAFVPVSADTLTLLEMAKKISGETGGAFSTTAGALTRLWKIRPGGGVMPDEEEINRQKELVNDADILLDEERKMAKLRRRGQSADLGGIAKGYAADEVRRILIENGIQEAVINLGGTVISIGKARSVGIQRPDSLRGVSMGTLRIQNQAVVTSGDYERYFIKDGKRFHHIIDPRTGFPAETDLRSVTVIGDSAAYLDGVSTALFIMGARNAAAFAAGRNIDMIMVTKALDVYCSERCKSIFSMFEDNRKLG